jgi:hypothetical protein
VILPIFQDFVKVMFLPSYSSSIYEELKEDSNAVILEEFSPSMISAVATFQRTQRETFPDTPDIRFLVLTDDCTSDTLKNNPAIKKGYTVYRNLNISTICSVQYIIMMNKESRANTNFSIYLRQNTLEARKTIMGEHISDLITDSISLDSKAAAYDQITEKYAIISDNINGVFYLLPRKSFRNST